MLRLGKRLQAKATEKPKPENNAGLNIYYYYCAGGAQSIIIIMLVGLNIYHYYNAGAEPKHYRRRLRSRRRESGIKPNPDPCTWHKIPS